MTGILWLDFETRSHCELKVRGGYNYAADSTTEITLAAYALDMGPIAIWEKLKGQASPVKLLNMLRDPAIEIRAHNAAFERLVLKHVWKIDLPPSRFYCTAFQSRTCGYPGSLEDAGRMIKSDMRKDTHGSDLIKLLCVPRENGTYCEEPDLYKKFAAYCVQDVASMREISMRLNPLKPDERALYEAGEIVNDRGLPIDLELCEWAVRYAEEEAAAAKNDIVRITKGACTSARGETLTDWIHAHVPDYAKRLMEVTKRKSIAIISGGAQAHLSAADGAGRPQLFGGTPYDALTLDASTREALFALAEERPGDFREDVLEALEANDAVMSSSVHKFKSMLNNACADGRLRGAFWASGAAGTGRFSSHDAQLHNFPRLTAADPEAIRKIMSRHGKLPGPTLEVLKSMLRPAIWGGAGRRIVRADWNAIEARALPYLTGRASAVRCLDAFRDPLRDLYLEDAAAVGFPGNRNVGKVTRLAFGYGGGERAFKQMAKSQKVVIPPGTDLRALKESWRRANPWAQEWWNECDRAALAALASTNDAWLPAGLISFKKTHPQELPGLRMLLPSGREIHYPGAAPTGESFGGSFSYFRGSWKPKAGAQEWPRARVWGGLLVENAVQAYCADLLRYALVMAVRAGLPIIGHVHDEMIGEESAGRAKALAEHLSAHMLHAPEWASGLPLAIETAIAPRFGK